MSSGPSECAAAASQPARRGAPRPRRPDGRVRGLGDADPVRRRPRRAPGLPQRRRRVRRLAPRVGAGARGRGRPGAPVGAHERPRPHRARQGPVHAPARPGRRARRRRHHRLVGGTGRPARHAERLQHRSHPRCAGRGRDRPRRRCAVRARGRHRVARGARGPGPACPRPPGQGAARRRDRPALRRAAGRRRAVPGLRGRDGLHRGGRRRAARAGRVGAGDVAGPARDRAGACRARRPRHAAPRGRPAAARPRARAGHHAARCGVGMGRALRQGRLPGP